MRKDRTQIDIRQQDRGKEEKIRPKHRWRDEDEEDKEIKHCQLEKWNNT